MGLIWRKYCSPRMQMLCSQRLRMAFVEREDGLYRVRGWPWPICRLKSAMFPTIVSNVSDLSQQRFRLKSAIRLVRLWRLVNAAFGLDGGDERSSPNVVATYGAVCFSWIQKNTNWLLLLFYCSLRCCFMRYKNHSGIRYHGRMLMLQR